MSACIGAGLFAPGAAAAAFGDCSQPVTSGSQPTASDCLYILRTGVGLADCELCVCDTNGSFSISATDALVCLKVAVDQPVPLQCPSCVVSTSTTTTSTSSSSSSTTTIPFCGDGFLDFGEDCDDGDNFNGDGCSADCLLEGGTCEADVELLCDDTDTWDTLEEGSTDRVEFYGCDDWFESGREYTYVFLPDFAENVLVEVFSEAGVDHDVFVLLDDGLGCQPGNCIAYGDDEAQFVAAAGEIYYIVVDGFEGDAGAFTIDLSCL
ncbi:MAG TPA: DUF4215 domain-containing protein [Candidatus Limnocylindrales bacterium]|nr:DUF4215 domain-containing protein [Candidatus Limnocylindrales bacterium]